MEQFDHITTVIALGMGAAWASGINLYATLLVLGLLGHTGHIALPADLQILTEPLVIAAAALMYCVEFFADKTPGVDTGWDALHTFIRVPAGAALAAGAVGQVDPVVALAAAVVGGGLAAGTHAVKSGSRVLINTSPEPVTNWGASLGEDALALGGLWLAVSYPAAFLVALALTIALMVWVLPKLWRAIKQVFRAVRDKIRPPSSTPVETTGKIEANRRRALPLDSKPS